LTTKQQIVISAVLAVLAVLLVNHYLMSQWADSIAISYFIARTFYGNPSLHWLVDIQEFFYQGTSQVLGNSTDCRKSCNSKVRIQQFL